MMIDIGAAFATIREKRDKLNECDDELIRIIQHVEAALAELRIGVPTDIHYPGRDEGDEDQWLSYGKQGGSWRVLHSYKEDGAQSLLLSSSRETRAEVFKALPEGPTPIEVLILGIADSIAYYTKERGPLVERAKALSAAILALGFALPTQGGA